MTEPLPLQRLDQGLFDRVAHSARQASRLRMNHNLHEADDLVQRFINVLQPGTYVRPHRHRRSGEGSGFECFVVLQGAVGLLLMNQEGEITQKERLDANGPLRGIELAENQVHTLVALEDDTVIFELKQGPYQPASDKDFLPGFPQEQSSAATEQEQRWRDLFLGSGHY